MPTRKSGRSRSVGSVGVVGLVVTGAGATDGVGAGDEGEDGGGDVGEAGGGGVDVTENAVTLPSVVVTATEPPDSPSSSFASSSGVPSPSTSPVRVAFTAVGSGSAIVTDPTLPAVELTQVHTPA